MTSQFDTVSTSTNTGASAPVFGRPLIPYFLTTICEDDKSKRKNSKKQDDISAKRALLTINMNHDLTEEQKKEQRKLILPKGNKDFGQIRRFNEEGYFEYDTLDLNEIKQNLDEAEIQLVTEKPTYRLGDIKEVTVLDENGQIVSNPNGKSNSQSYYEKMMSMSSSLLRKGGKYKYGREKQKKHRKRRKSRSPHKKGQKPRDTEESFEETTDDETSATSNSDHSSDEEGQDDVNSHIDRLLQSGQLISPLDLLNLSKSAKPSKPTSSLHSEENKITHPLPLPNNQPLNHHSIPTGNIQNAIPNPTPINPLQLHPLNPMNPMNPMKVPPPYFEPPFPPQGMYPGYFDPYMAPHIPPGPTGISMIHPVEVHYFDKGMGPETKSNDAPQTETEILKNLGLEQKKSREKFAAGSWSNSPPPSSLPNPDF